MKTVRALVAAGLVVATFGVALAKLPPAPPPTEEQKKAAEEKKAKDAAAADAAKAAQARAEDRTAARYFAEAKAKGKQVPAPQMGPAAPAAQPAATPPKPVIVAPPKK
jgi:flagellar biosynthesis/type III secretory pathway protein FliH